MNRMTEEQIRKHYKELKKNRFDIFSHEIIDGYDYYELLNEDQFVQYAQNNKKVDMIFERNDGTICHYPNLNIGFS